MSILLRASHGALFARLLAVASFGAAMSACSSGSNTVALTRQPAAWHVQAGAQSQSQANQGLSFYPSSTLTIDAGDTVSWSFPAGEPHTVALLGAGQTKPPAANDPNVAKPAGTAVYDGSTFTSSGFKLLGQTYALQFTKPGTYTVYCLIHQPEMVQTIVVQAAGAPLPLTQPSIDAQIATASTADLAAAIASDATFPYAANGLHLAAGISPGGIAAKPASSTVLRFLATSDAGATSTTIPVGSTVMWTNLSNNEPHTITFGPVGRPFPTLAPGSPPSGGTVFDGSQLVNTGPLFPGQSASITFPKAGTYTYHCLYHDDTEGMIATLVVR